MKTLALVLMLGTPEGGEQWTVLDHLTSDECTAIVEVMPQDFILATFVSEHAPEGFEAVMSHPNGVWWASCLERSDT